MRSRATLMLVALVLLGASFPPTSAGSAPLFRATVFADAGGEPNVSISVGGDRSLLDYLWNAVDPFGRAYAVFPSDGPASGGGDTDVILVRQTAGTFIGRGAPS